MVTTTLALELSGKKARKLYETALGIIKRTYDNKYITTRVIKYDSQNIV